MTPSVDIERRMPYPVEQVFAAWVRPEQFARWFLPDPNVRLGRVEVDAREGGKFLIEMIVGGDTLAHTGTYRRVVENREIAFTWISGATAGNESLVEVRFESLAAHTLVKLRHTGLPSAESRDRHSAGWTNILSTLDSFISADKSK
jgi:uncharacterized protein YndB with AHSA1/START domain